MFSPAGLYTILTFRLASSALHQTDHWYHYLLSAPYQRLGSHNHTNYHDAVTCRLRDLGERHFLTSRRKALGTVGGHRISKRERCSAS